VALTLHRQPHRDITVGEKAKAAVGNALARMLKLGMFFQWCLLQRIPVYLAGGDARYAWTDGFRIYLGKGFLEAPPRIQLDILRHELYHIVLGHHLQLRARLSRASNLKERNIVEAVYNLIADAIVNGLIKRENEGLGLGGLAPDWVTPEAVTGILEDDVVKLGFTSAVERLLYLVWRGDVTVEARVPGGAPIDLSSTPISKAVAEYGMVIVRFVNRRNNSAVEVALNLDVGGGGGGQPLHPVNKPIGRPPETWEEVEQAVREAWDYHVHQASARAVSPEGAATAVYELTDVEARRPEWEAQLTQTLTHHLSRYAVVSWRFVNRRAPYTKPGVRYLSPPDIHILLDTSGSMLGKPLERALKRVIYIAERYPDVKVKLYQWSTECTLPEDIDRRFSENVKRYRRLRVKTGGTVIAPALDMALKHVKPGDAVVILTDGYIYDIDSADVRRRLEELSRRAGVVVFASVGYIPGSLPSGIRKIRLEE